MRRVSYTISLLLAVALGFFFGRSVTVSIPPARRVLYYVDPMHPAYQSDQPGIAPDCGMRLEPVYADEAHTAIAQAGMRDAPDAVMIDSPAQQLGGVRVTSVEKTAGTRTIRIPGRVVADETRLYRVTAGVDGFVRDTHDDTVGSHVRNGQRLASIYSPDYVSAIGGYVSAASAAGGQGQVGIQNWVNRLRYLGMSDAQINELSVTSKAPEGVYVVSPVDGFILTRNISPGLRFERNMEFYRVADLSHVWIVADFYDGENHDPRPGAAARITLRNQNKGFSARVSQILPQIDSATRAVKLRLEAANPDLTLRPDMFVNVDLTVASPPGLSVPVDAVIDSGMSSRVYVDRGNGIFEPRQVDAGERFGDRVQILRGLSEGERVVASGTFLVDSETRLRSTPGITHLSTAKSGSSNGFE
jgi:membrane fusion protein, copper/silver efflux system